MAWQRQRPFEYVCVRNASIAWEARLTDDRLTYSPILQYESVALGSQAPSGLVDLKLRQVDSVPIVYEMAGLVRMMRPSWCGHAPVYTCFREEAETLAMDYVFKLAGEFGYDVELKKR